MAMSDEKLQDGWVFVDESLLIDEHWHKNLPNGWCKVREDGYGGFVWEYHTATKRGSAGTLFSAMDAASAAAGGYPPAAAGGGTDG
jgi:hypothetical protein